MKIELLNVRIYVSKNTVVADAIGNRKNEWQPYYTCYATVSAEGGKEMTDAGMVVNDSTIDFTIRWCRQSAAITSTGYRVQFQDELYDILTVDHMPGAYFWFDSDSSEMSINRRERYCSGTYPGPAVGRPDTRQNGATWPMILKGGMNSNVLWSSLHSGFHSSAP